MVKKSGVCKFCGKPEFISDWGICLKCDDNQHEHPAEEIFSSDYCQLCGAVRGICNCENKYASLSDES